MHRTISYATIEAAHVAWTDAAANAEPGAVRLLFTRGMKAIRAELVTYQAERNQLSLDYAKRDDDGNAMPVFDGEAKPVPGLVAIEDGPAYMTKLGELQRQSVTVDLPALTDDLLTKTAASAESLAVLLDYVAGE